MLSRIKNLVKRLVKKETQPCYIESNVGEKVIAWPGRIELALNMLNKHLPSNASQNVADYGAGQQTLKKYIPGTWNYTPFDFYKRTEDTVVINFNESRPNTDFDVIFCLGVFEYLDEPYALLESIVKHGTFGVLSYTGFTTEETRRANGWKNNLELSEIEQKIDAMGGEVLEKEHYRNNQWVYVIKGMKN